MRRLVEDTLYLNLVQIVSTDRACVSPTQRMRKLESDPPISRDPHCTGLGPAVIAGHKVRFISAADLMLQLAAADKRKAGQAARRTTPAQ
jgi:hypothetical protein